MQRILAIFVLILSVTACSMPETKVYSLYLPAGKTSPEKKSDISMAILLDAPRHLSQPYIAARNSPYQFTISKYSKWDSPPSEIVKEAFRESLYSTGLFKEVRVSSITPYSSYSLRIRLKKFEMHDDSDGSFGVLVFDAELLSPDGTEQYRSTISKKVKLEARTFLSLAKGLSSALSEGIEEVKTNVVKVISNP